LIRALLAALAIAAAAQASAADPGKVIRTAYPSAESKLDPQAESDEASGAFNNAIFDSLLEYDYLARPAKLRPRAALAMPEVTDKGATYTFRIKPGIFFTPDPAFKGVRRELVAADYAYSLKRLFDPKVKSQWLFLVEGKIKGADALMEAAKSTGKLDFDTPIEGLQVLDRHTLRIKLNEPDHRFPFILALPPSAALAREVVEFYGDDIAAHPVGTGPYMIGAWVRGSKITLLANPGYREDIFESEPADDPYSQAIYRALKGKRLPIAGVVEVTIVDEAQPRWLAFLGGEHEYLRPLPEEFAPIALPGGRLAPNLVKKGITTTPDEIAYTTYTTWNMQDPVVGGYTPEKVALRRAITHAWPIEEQIATLDRYQSEPAQSPLPPGVIGYDPKFASPTLGYDPPRAKALLDLYGYVDRDGDGWREMPDGTPLVIDHASVPTLRERQRNELWKKAMDAIGVRMTFNKVEKLPELRKQARLGKVQTFSYGWIADYPDGENFLQLLWGGSIGQANYAMFDLPEYNALFVQAKALPPTPERDRLYERMVKLILVYNPWMVETYKRNIVMLQPWLIGYKKHPFMYEPWRYLDIDLARLAKR
jgi:ABC-type transport system substrate-binding protein